MYCLGGTSWERLLSVSFSTRSFTSSLLSKHFSERILRSGDSSKVSSRRHNAGGSALRFSNTSFRSAFSKDLPLLISPLVVLVTMSCSVGCACCDKSHSEAPTPAAVKAPNKTSSPSVKSFKDKSS
ncbi:hypothetical protein GDO81_018897 [Engystomops pustulosus]|uniref:Agouti signaling protein n=1 Tax=Engystomops pustulosus TaxID=76066 RepID=A0AAV6YTC9_ENGPU|nr:hypothetical protein GDO81_018897 [Engystomops pustulosus]